MRLLLAALLVTALTVAAAVALTGPAETPVVGSPRVALIDPAPVLQPRLPLAGKVIVLDPGHQLGNRNFPAEINRQVDAGGFTKACNTTGTASDAGLPEATFTWQIAQQLRRKLARLGATVQLTRSANSDELWGPCVDERGRAGRGEADLMVSIHADGSLVPGAHGFHVIASAAPDRESSVRLAETLRAGLVDVGLPVANYVAGDDGLDLREDLGTRNLATVPAAMVELGNMRSPDDAGLMSSRPGRSTYVRGLVRGVRDFLR